MDFTPYITPAITAVLSIFGTVMTMRLKASYDAQSSAQTLAAADRSSARDFDIKAAQVLTDRFQKLMDGYERRIKDLVDEVGEMKTDLEQANVVISEMRIELARANATIEALRAETQKLKHNVANMGQVQEGQLQRQSKVIATLDEINIKVSHNGQANGTADTGPGTPATAG